MQKTEAVRWMRDLDHQYRQQTGLEIRSYKIFYSLIQPAPILVLGINPGGRPEAFSQEVEQFYPSSWVPRILANEFWFENGEHEYVDCNYPIARVMSRFLQRITGLASAEVRGIPKTNMVFRRSPGVDDFRAIHGMSIEEAEAESRPFVSEILRRVSPQVIVLEGIKALELFRSAHGAGAGQQLMPPVMADYRGRSVRFCVAERMGVRGLNGEVRVIAIGHPSVCGGLPGFESATVAARQIYWKAVSGARASGAAAGSRTGMPSGNKVSTGSAPPDCADPPLPEPPAGSGRGTTGASGNQVSAAVLTAGMVAPATRTADPRKESTVAADVLHLGHGCEVRVLPAGRMNRLEIWRGGERLGEYERSNDREVNRKIGEIRSALTLLLDLHLRHGQFEVRWDSKARRKVVRVAGVEVGVIGREHWGRPSWER